MALLALAGCRKEEKEVDPNDPSVVGMGLPDTSSEGKVYKMERECELDKLINMPVQGSPEAVVHALLSAAASKEDSDAAFQKFLDQFPPGENARSVKSLYWAKARRYVDKYLVPGQEGVAFKVCRKEERSDGKIKMFILSFDEDKSNPPITVGPREGGGYQVESYTP